QASSPASGAGSWSDATPSIGKPKRGPTSTGIPPNQRCRRSFVVSFITPTLRVSGPTAQTHPRTSSNDEDFQSSRALTCDVEREPSGSRWLARPKKRKYVRTEDSNARPFSSTVRGEGPDGSQAASCASRYVSFRRRPRGRHTTTSLRKVDSPSPGLLEVRRTQPR